MTEPYLIAGIDPGVNTGYAVYNIKTKTLECVESKSIHKCLSEIEFNFDQGAIKLVRFEDARLRKYFTGGKEKAQGAGSIKRDSKIWEDFLTDLEIPFQMVAPKDNRTKLNAVTFKEITGYPHKTNEHGRDAAMLVFGIKH